MTAFLTPYELNELAGTIVDRDSLVPAQLMSHFTGRYPYSTLAIPFDKIMPDNRISMYVGPLETAPIHVQRGYETKVQYGLYWKEKTTVEFENLHKRRYGQPFNSPVSLAQNARDEIVRNMKEIIEKRDRLLELTAAQILLYGNYTGKSIKHPNVVVDFEPYIATHLTTNGQQDSGSTVPAAQGVALNSGRANRANISGTDVTGPTGQVIPTLGTNRAWGAASDTPMADMQTMFNGAYETIGTIYMDADTFEILSAEPTFQKVVNPYSNTTQTAILNLLPSQQSKLGIKILGFWAGGVPIIEYSATYQPRDVASGWANEVRYIPKGWIVMVPNISAYGVKALGPVQHFDANYGNLDIFWNSWAEPELGQPWTQGQAAMTLLHSKINSTIAWKVK